MLNSEISLYISYPILKHLFIKKEEPEIFHSPIHSPNVHRDQTRAYLGSGARSFFMMSTWLQREGLRSWHPLLPSQIISRELEHNGAADIHVVFTFSIQNSALSFIFFFVSEDLILSQQLGND